MQYNFLKQIQSYIALLSADMTATDTIRSLADFIFYNHEFLDNSKATLDLVNALGDWLEGINEERESIAAILHVFWLHYIEITKVDIFYIGSMEKLMSLTPRFNAGAIERSYFLSGNNNNEQEIVDFFSIMETSMVPVLIYDAEGLKVVLENDADKAVVCISYYDFLQENFIPASTTENAYAALLAHAWDSLADKSVETVIIGNSYGYYGFPEPVLSNGKSVNLSMHSLGIKQAQQLTDYILVHHPHINHFVYCFGFFDLYYDLLKSTDSFNQQIIEAFSQLVCHYGIPNAPLMEGRMARLLGRLVIRGTECRSQINGLDNVQKRTETYRNNLLLLMKENSLSKVIQPQVAIGRASLHSKSVTHKQTFKENTYRARIMNKSLIMSGKKAVWLTPPFPAAYVNQINQEMKLTHRHFFAGLEGKQSVAIDLSEHRYFKHDDFRDGDHLNFKGARKLAVKLRKLNVVL